MKRIGPALEALIIGGLTAVVSTVLGHDGHTELAMLGWACFGMWIGVAGWRLWGRLP